MGREPSLRLRHVCTSSSLPPPVVLTSACGRRWHVSQVPIYYASYTSDKAHRVYETYVNMMNAHVRQQVGHVTTEEGRGRGRWTTASRPFHPKSPLKQSPPSATNSCSSTCVRNTWHTQMDVANPFRFQFVRNLKTVHEVDDFSPSVVLASPGFLNSGHSRQLFDRYVHMLILFVRTHVREARSAVRQVRPCRNFLYETHVREARPAHPRPVRPGPEFRARSELSIP